MQQRLYPFQATPKIAQAMVPNAFQGQAMVSLAKVTQRRQPLGPALRHLEKDSSMTADVNWISPWDSLVLVAVVHPCCGAWAATLARQVQEYQAA